MQPGDTITPTGGQPQTPETPETPMSNEQGAASNELAARSSQETVSESPKPEVPQPVAPVSPAPLVTAEPETIPSYNQPVFDIENDNPTELPQVETISWSASEFIEHEKPHGWYAILAAGAILLSTILYFLVRDVVTVVVVGIATVLLGVVGARKPRSMNYALSQTGIQIGEKTYPYSIFKSFSMIEEGAIDSIQLMPLKRIMPPVSIYFPPEQGDQIFEILSAYLPHEDREHDPLDRLMKRLHF